MFENFRIMIIGGFYYGILFIIGSIIVTMMLNKVFDKLYMPPLIINTVSVSLLITSYRIGAENTGFVLYFNYMPAVLASILCNLRIFIIGKFNNRRDVKK